MVALLSIIKLITEIALMALLGRFVLGLLAGQKREQNIFYQMLEIMTRPFVRGVRLITPKLVLDRHLPLVAFFVLLFAWLAATLARISICVQIGVHLCK